MKLKRSHAIIIDSLTGMAIHDEYYTLSNGQIIPAVGLDKLDETALQAVIPAALHSGVRAFDCASRYENEAIIGNILKYSLKEQHISRSSVFIISKLWMTDWGHVKSACFKSMAGLQTNYLDMYLVHWPFAFKADENGKIMFDADGAAIVDHEQSLERMWKDMEELVHEGFVKSIGISNFTIEQMKKLLSFATIKPVVNEIELHPYCPQTELLAFCRSNGIHVIAYRSLGAGYTEPNLMTDPVAVKVAEKEGISVARVLLSWAKSKGCTIIPRTSKPERIEDNCNLPVLQPENADAINGITIRHKYCSSMRYWKYPSND